MRRYSWSCRGDPVELIDQFAFLFTIKSGRVVREQAFRNRDEALDAAWLPD
jgi:hypothetical protein